MKHGRFFEVSRTARTTSEGVVELPILYYVATNVVGLFAVEPHLTGPLLDGTGLEPILFRDRAIVALSFFEYLSSSVGAYNEVGTAILAKRIGAKTRWSTSAAYVVDLPVTTAAANAAGREIWGYPKFVTPISFELRGRDVRSAVSDPSGGEPIVTIAGRMGLSIPSPPISFMTFTLLGGTLLRTNIDVRGRCAIHRRGDVSLRVGSSEHRMARNLRALDLDGARPVAIVTTKRFVARLHAGVAA